MRTEAVVVVVEQVPFAPFPHLMEAKAVGEGYGAVGRAVNDTGRAFVAGCRLVDGKPESRRDLVAAKAMPPHLDVFWRVLRVVETALLPACLTTDGIVADNACRS